MHIEHADRRQLVEQISNLNRRSNGD